MYSVTTVEPLIKNLPPFKGHFLWSQMLVFAYLQSGAHKRKERSAAIYPNVNSAARCARRVSDDVYYQQSKESDVDSLAHAQQSSQSRQRLLQLPAGNKIIWIGCTVVTEYCTLDWCHLFKKLFMHVDRGRGLFYKHRTSAVPLT